jgi:hypothetical protein
MLSVLRLMHGDSAVRDWAWEEFGHAVLGDQRRTMRLVRMAAAAAARPASRPPEVFQTSAERQGAYDFIDNDKVPCSALTEAMCKATACRASAYSTVFVAVDGSAVSVTDRTGNKGMGNVGSTAQGGRGLKVLTAYAVSEDGTPLGVTSQRWWARKSGKKRHDRAKRKVNEKETSHWLKAIVESREVLGQHAGATRPWFVLDREADNRHQLELLARLEGSYFSVRSSSDRRLVDENGKAGLIEHLRKQAPLGSYFVEVPGGHGRTARRARLVVRATTVTLRLRDSWTKKLTPLKINVVEAREEQTVPHGEKAVEWRLLTNAPVDDFGDSERVIFSYAQRWRIEEFHKTWKSGACDVESCQLRKRDNVIRWATILAATAARIERLKVRSRNEPTLPADIEFTQHEIRAIILLKRRHKKRTETIDDTMPSLSQATLWLAELGGYTGKSSGGPPGSITIRRGLEYIKPVALLLDTRAEADEIR